MFDDKSKPVLDKKTTMREISSHLSKNPKTSIDSIRAIVKQRLEHEGTPWS